MLLRMRPKPCISGERERVTVVRSVLSVVEIGSDAHKLVVARKGGKISLNC
jgi:hypothetical protein